MSRPERQQNVLELLKGLRGIEPLKQLFWSELNYQRVNQPLSRRGWPEPAHTALADDPVLFAGGGDDNAFHVIYCRLAKNLARGSERPVVAQLLREHPYALFIFSDKSQTDWHFLNVKFDDQAERRQLYRRITVRPGAGLRTATERVQLLDLAEIHPELFGITPLAIQQRCDAAFDVETVTKDFFTEVANWYFWALKNAKFPKDAPKEADGHDHISIIRLITRLIFCWFVKEKRLIPDTLFDQQKLAAILTGFEPAKASAKQSVFYKAILQNLFFATLNTEMDKRAWRKDDANFMAHILYRHKTLFQKPGEALDLFKNIPFLNGGLFECLDKREGTPEKPKDIRIDGFSDRSDSQPTVPDFLFFGPEREVDLSEEYDDRKFKSVPVRGLIHIFNRYNFTVEEDTPIDQEVALDPELSGKVFENLLAAYNPETGATARKQTGSFYTPREIVNYMVDESLIGCLKAKLETVLPSTKDAEARLRHLFAYTTEPRQFTPSEVDALIAIIDSLKTLDPAVGSGAFPMGILHKLVFILGKLDPRNEKWEQRQIQRVQNTIKEAEKTEDAPRREKMVSDLEQQIAGIKEAFEHNELDYGRKLYLIENCIYGVDIQPIAVQIAKMRFFISLIVDQKIDDTQANRGVRPLPNLETKFVAADSLIGVARPGQQLLRNREIDDKEAELRRVRQRHFDAKTPKQKTKYRDDDAQLRTEIADLLKGDGWDTATAHKLASWNPYDQNTSADFFDAEWMFGLTEGFDICVANPPYVSFYSRQSQSDRNTKEYLNALIAAYIFPENKKKLGRFNTLMFFVEKGLSLVSKDQFLIYIIDTNIHSNPSVDIRRFILSNTQILEIVDDLSAFENVASSQMIILLKKTRSGIYDVVWKCYDQKQFKTTNKQSIVHINSNNNYCFKSPASSNILSILQKIKLNDPFQQLLGKEHIRTCITFTGRKDRFVISNPELKIDHPLLEGASGVPFPYASVKFETYVRYDLNLRDKLNKEYLQEALQENKRSPKVIGLGNLEHFKAPKIFVRLSDIRLTAAYSEDFICADLSLYVITLPNLKATDRHLDLKLILGVLNSRLLTFYLIQSNLIRNLNTGTPQIRLKDIRELPFKIPENSQRSLIINCVEEILSRKALNATSDTSALERKIDQQIYALYRLTPEEIKIVEAAS